MSARKPHGQSYADVAANPPPKTDSIVAPAVPSDVIFKLLAFTAAMVFGPIGMYFLTVNTIFGGNPTYAGIVAAVTANVVLFAYIYVAWKEDQGDREEAAKANSKKGQ
ncbi:Vacuolar ATPase assembly integral membrane protein vma21 [Penicillium waksmanii]|uniref:Vacuolar ATPase assembly integral membrane protein vma21 n=1 Tax=Penicillium waksmanii TaxID=69791 RepID=UPI00254667C9|nr:Vacuolar ATPase assembly integral membrane protein vma21 [Penicillium waksmanii]KAJ5965438.1 Vacuolar ATPase assembly integral membrane protein vma21 [Penicillium waksmanii]